MNSVRRKLRYESAKLALSNPKLAPLDRDSLRAVVAEYERGARRSAQEVRNEPEREVQCGAG